ncbi:MAG: glycosyltransferase family 4 protein [Acidimicrobiales bacterium]
MQPAACLNSAGATLTRRPRVVLLAHEIKAWGGMDMLLAELVRQGHDRFDFVVVSTVLAEELRPLVAEWHRVRVPRRPFPLRFACFWVLAGRISARLHADLVQATGAIVPRAVDVIGVYHCHRAYRADWFSPGAPLTRRLNTMATRLVGALAEHWCYRASRVRMLACISSGLQADLGRYFPGVPSLLVSPGVDGNVFRPKPEIRAKRIADEGGPSAPMLVAFVGGDWHRKGLDIALKGLAEAVRRGADLSMWIAGRHDEGWFRELPAALGVAERVRFLGSPAEVASVYQAADVFLLPSSYETFSLPAHEAAACGLPVVATAVHGVSALVGDNVAGLVIERNPSAVADALVTLWEDPDLRERLGREGCQRARELTWDSYAKRMLALYQDLLAASPPMPVGDPSTTPATE